ncbi:hypothetical protein [Rubellimicrobium rubrum]|uniref:hypothetical protein n=1 Tax=Rubellimicrobium rubrum TaxID=2585369 RepID=UPI00159BE706|nr:hypothetical protein [Rubellimicrobium rubrum]
MNWKDRDYTGRGFAPDDPVSAKAVVEVESPRTPAAHAQETAVAPGWPVNVGLPQESLEEVRRNAASLGSVSGMG